MSNQNYITNILNLKANNLIFKENFYYEEKRKGITHKFFEAYLSYKPSHSPKCGVLFDEKFEKRGVIVSNIKISDISLNQYLNSANNVIFLCIVIKLLLFLLT